MRLSDLVLGHPFADDEDLVHNTEGAWTAGAVRARVRELADRLGLELGDGGGRAVAVQLPNGPELLCTMAAVWDLGAVLVPVNDRATSTEVASICAETGAAALVDRDGVHRLEGDRIHGDDIAFVVWTSGTTGRPAPILHTHTGYLELLDRMVGPLRAGSGRTGPRMPNLIPVSMALNAGLYNTLFGLRVGAALVLMDRFDPHEFATLIGRHSIRSTVLPPAAMVTVLESGVLSLTPLTYLRSITAPLSPLQARRFSERFGVFVLNSYGQAEMGEVIGWTAADAKQWPEKVGAAGRPHPGVEVRLAEDGRLLVRPRESAVGLASRRDAEGFIDTGDIARIDDDGFVWIEGRSSDVINRGGNKVFPDAVEEVLRLHPGVVDAAVVGVPDERLGEVPVAFVVGAVDEPELVDHCRTHLVPYKVPVRFLAIDVLPRNEIGKVLRRELAAQWSAEERSVEE